MTERSRSTDHGRLLYTLARVATLLILTFGARPAMAQDYWRHNSGQPYLSPEETVRRFQVHAGFEAKLFAAEPDLANPIAMAFDERGRLYVIECFEYPKGTPPGEKPKDRIKIFEDTDGDHRADKVTVFAEGFNLATGIAVGHGGVFLGVAPDLLFLRDTDGDDRADTREVLLTGFGRQDTHELLNTFTWGPDGWLYGLHGVFTHSKVRRGDAGDAEEPQIDMNAAVWRYHPRSRRFEIFGEGTSNPWGLDFDSRGNMFITACVIPHLFHIAPGGRYIRQAGQNRNPYDFGQLKEISDHRHHEESGWAHAGCVVLDGELWPAELRDSVIFGSIHGNSIKRDVLKRNGSTYVAGHAADFLKSGDKNFRPVHQEIGPDGSVFIIDWHDQWPCHQTPPDAWDKERGRVYKIVPRKPSLPPPGDMSRLSDIELVDQLKSPNPYVHRTARRLLDERQAKSAIEVLERMAVDGDRPDLQLRGLWALHSVGGLDLASADRLKLWDSPNPSIRAWTVRLLGDVPARDAWRAGGSAHRAAAAQANDRSEPDGALAKRLLALARSESDADVRLQLAATSQRVGSPELAQVLALRDADAGDPVIPLMVWFALEPSVVPERAELLEWLKTAGAGRELVVRELVPRVMRRLVATDRPDAMASCLAFALEVQDAATRRAALEGMAAALAGRRHEPPGNWSRFRAALAADSDPTLRSLVRQLGAHFRDPAAVRDAETIALDTKADVRERVAAVRSLAVAQLPSSLEPLTRLLAGDAPAELHGEVLRSLGAYDRGEIAALVVAEWKDLSPALRAEALTLLTGRRDWAHAVLDAVAAGTLGRDDLSAPAAQRIANLKDPELDAKLQKAWGTVRAQTPQEIDELLKRMRRVVASAPGDAAAGRAVFEKRCGVCHKFNGQGHDVGPDITGADRSVEYLLINILDPNRVVGQPYYTHVVATKSGRVISGKLVSDTPNAITLHGENNKVDVIARDEIDEYVIKSTSVMPEGLPKDVSDTQFRDLIEFLRRR